MINRNTKTKNKKSYIILAIIIALVVLGAVAYLNRNAIVLIVKPNNQATPGSNQNAPKEADDKPQSEAKTRQEQASQTQTSSGTINPQITSITQDTNSVYVRAIVDGVKDGNCTLKMQRSGSSDIIKTAPVAQVTSYYACQGFNIAKSEIKTKGEWSVVVQFSNSQGSGQAEDKINVN